MILFQYQQSLNPAILKNRSKNFVHQKLVLLKKYTLKVSFAQEKPRVSKNFNNLKLPYQKI